MLRLCPLPICEAQKFVNDFHRHHKAPQGARFAVGIEDESGLVGVAIAGNPVARELHDGYTIEITRCCVMEGVYNGCSMLYSAVCRAAKALGYRKAITYILESELGTSLKASGFSHVANTVGGRDWSCPSRPREGSYQSENKKRFERILG